MIGPTVEELWAAERERLAEKKGKDSNRPNIIEYDVESGDFTIEHDGAFYEFLTKPVADAIVDAHTRLGWDKSYEEIESYLAKNYPYLFK